MDIENRGFDMDINGEVCRVRITINGGERSGISNLFYQEELKGEDRSRRTLSCSVCFDIAKAECASLIGELAIAANALGIGATYADVPFGLTTHAHGPGVESGRLPSSIEVKDAKIMSFEERQMAGSGALVMRVNLLVNRPLRKTFGGKIYMMVADPLDGPGCASA